MSIAKALEGTSNWLRQRTIQGVYCDRVTNNSIAALRKYGVTFGFFCIGDQTPWQ